jgi:signal transduction histidine kinase
MRHLAGSVLTAQDQERRRIARELHDSTGQNLIAAGMLIGRVRAMLPDPDAQPARQLADMVQQSLGEVRTVSYLLHPPLLDEAGLRLALLHYIEGLAERSDLVVALDIVPDLPRLAPEVELALFRVVQEALTNVARHSRSKSAHVRLAREVVDGRRSVVLTVEDRDTGRSPAAGFAGLAGAKPRFRLGIGLTSMQERLRQVGGELDIDGGPGGTMVTAIVPAHDGGLGQAG